MKKIAAPFGTLILSLAMIGAAFAQAPSAKEQMQLDMIAPVVRIVVDTGESKDVGSGTIIYSSQHNGSVETYILTNNHVVEDAVIKGHSQVDVDRFSYNGKGSLIATTKMPARVVAFDKDVDLAVVKLVDDTNQFPTAVVTKDDAVNVFDKVFAIGSGLGQPTFATDGIISQTDSEEDGQRLLQVSAPIIMGNSGGALFRFEDASGHYELIGVPARVATYGLMSVNQNMGYAIPASTVRDFLKDQRWDLGFIVE